MSHPDGCRLVVSDLDGTLLDGRDYSFEAARPALAALGERGIPLVLCSSKTRAEMEPLAAVLGLATPLIVENGGALVFPADMLPASPAHALRDGHRIVVPLGRPRAELLRALPEVAGEAGVRARGFHQMTPQEVASLTGLTLEGAARALEREWDEPFVVEGPAGPDAERDLGETARRHGLRVTRGGRFHHLTGDSDKGKALRTLLDLLPLATLGQTVGLGDAANDLPLLRVVDRPILMPREDGSVDPALAAALPGAERAPAPGPRGWAEAVLAALEGKALSGVAS